MWFATSLETCKDDNEGALSNDTVGCDLRISLNTARMLIALRYTILVSHLTCREACELMKD